MVLPPGVDYFFHRLLLSKYQCTPTSLETEWSLADAVDAHAVLDAFSAAGVDP